MAELVVTVDVDAPAPHVWTHLVDWDLHARWMLATRARVTDRGAGGEPVALEAITGVGPIAVRDTMVITSWEPPRSCRVEHTGGLIRGAGAFEVEPRGDGRATVVWSEWLVLPFGPLGAVGWLGVRPLARAFLGYSLRRFARIVESDRR